MLPYFALTLSQHGVGVVFKGRPLQQFVAKGPCAAQGTKKFSQIHRPAIL